MRIELSGVGCSVVALKDLSDSTVRKIVKKKDIWTGDQFWQEDTSSPRLDVFTPEGLKVLVTVIKRMHPTGVVIFADNETKYGRGSKLAKWLRENGYRVDESEPYVNENHRAVTQNKKDADKCVLYTWYWQSRTRGSHGNKKAKKDDESGKNSRSV